MSEKKLKPVVFVRGDYNKKYLQNTLQQKVLLKATQITDDPKELRRMIGVKSVADVYRTLDKMAMRKDFHMALRKKGVSWEYLVGGLKDIADSADSDGVKLKALTTLLKTFGLDTYDEKEAGGGSSWEDLLNKAAESNKDLIEGSVAEEGSDKQYEVNVPEVPKEEARRIDEERKLGRDLYETKTEQA